MNSVDEQTVESLYRRYFPIILNKCGRTLRDRSEAQDVAQETFIRLWKQRAKIRNPNAVVAWIYRTSARLAIDRAKAGYRLSLFDDTESDVIDSSHSMTPERKMHWNRIVDEVAHLPAEELEVAILSRIDLLTHSEIASVTKRSERTIRRQLSRIDERLSRIRERSAL